MPWQFGVARILSRLRSSPDDTRRFGPPGYSPALKADHHGLLFVRRNLDVSQPCGVIDTHVDRSYLTPADLPCWRLPVIRCHALRL